MSEQNVGARISKIEDNVFILHDKIEELSNMVVLQKTMIDELLQEVERLNNIVY